MESPNESSRVLRESVEELLTVTIDCASPLKRSRQAPQQDPFMKRAGREAPGEAPGLMQPRRTQAKIVEGGTGNQMIEKQPTEREIAAAKAARARLYGGEGSAQVCWM